MLQQILVPLDGSRLAEAALAPAVLISQAFGLLPITLIHIIERNAPQVIHGEEHLQKEAEAREYLDRIATSLPVNIPHRVHVHEEEVRNVVKSIVAHADELSQDLIVMCTHGSGAPRQWIVGSIAQQVIGFGKTPVLLVQPDKNAPDLNLERMLVALDEDPTHRSGLEMAIEWARQIHSNLVLLSVVPTPKDLRGEPVAAERLTPGATSALLDIYFGETQQILGRLAKHYQSQGIPTSSEVHRGDPAQEIVRAAESVQAGMIVIGTHGRAGWGAFWAGSVAPRIPSLTKIPLLLVPSQKSK